MVIKRSKALEILEQAVEEAQASEGTEYRSDYHALIQEICNLARNGSATTIAALGTMILAKATDADVAVHTLKSNLPDDGAYSARSLCQHVLAANAIRLDLDIGVTGREPLNNQPYFGKSRLSEALDSAHSRAIPAISKLIEFADILDCVDEETALGVLIDYCSIQSGRRESLNLNLPDTPYNMSMLRHWISTFMETSEGGKRAQSVAAGLCDLLVSEQITVSVDAINDPDRKFPGDIGIYLDDEKIPHQVIEVRDKPVGPSDIAHVTEKCANAGVQRAVILAVSNDQDLLDIVEQEEIAEEYGVLVQSYFGWSSFLMEQLLRSHAHLGDVMSFVAERIYCRAQELNVSDAGISLWRSLTRDLID